MSELRQSQRRTYHQSHYSIDSADQGAGGYRFGSLRGSDNSGRSGANRRGKLRDRDQQHRDHQQQIPQQVHHDSNFESHTPQRTARRQLRLPEIRRPSVSSRRSSLSSHSSAEQQNQSFVSGHGSIISQEVNKQRRAYREIAITPTPQRRRRAQKNNMLSQSLVIGPRRQGRDQRMHSQSVHTSRHLAQSQSIFKKEEEEGEAVDDEFDTIPLVSDEYLEELTSRSPATQVKNDDSERNRLNPNNNFTEASNSMRDSVHSSLTQSMRMSTRRSGEDIKVPFNRRMSRGSDHSSSSNQDSNHRRTIQDSDSRHSFGSNQKRPRRLRQSLRDAPQQERQQSARVVSSSFNERQMRRYSQKDPIVAKAKNPHLFYSQRLPPTANIDRGNFDIYSASFRQSKYGGDDYDNEIITAQQQGELTHHPPPEGIFTHEPKSTMTMAPNGSAGKDLDNANTATLKSKLSAPIGKTKIPLMGVIGIGLVVAIVMVVVIVYITTYQSSGEKSKQIQPQIPLPEEDFAGTSDCEECISQPASDIEGRCSASNLPGSLSACREACEEAACCYSSFKGTKCYNTSNEATLLACGEYMPHCDVLYRPWKGGSKGLIPDAPTVLFQSSDWDEICKTDTKERKLSPNNSSETFTCLDFCLPSKCCFAPMVQSDLATQGLLLNQDGSYHSAETYEYIMTSCMEKNYNSCLRYSEACQDLIIDLSFWQDAAILELSSISFSPSTSAMPSTSTSWPTFQPITEQPTESPTTFTPTKGVSIGTVDQGKSLPTLSPSTKVVTLAPTLSPTTLPPVLPTVVVPIADLSRIKNACTGFQNYNLIAKGEFNARNKCRSACIEGLCCFKELGLGINDSCFKGNEDICALYSDCLVLKAKPNNVLNSDSNSVGPTTPSDDLASLCSLDEISTPIGIWKCSQACLPSSWCCAANGNPSCFVEFEESCSAYSPCQALHDKYGGDYNRALPPIPPTSLQYACSYPELRSFHQSNGNSQTECGRMCDVGMCCLDGTCGEGMAATRTEIADRCAAYEPCRHLQELPDPPVDMETSCKDKESSQCIGLCLVASCCWLSNEGSCFVNFEQRCLSYAAYCSPIMSAGDFPTPPQPPPPDLCMSGPPSACRNACLKGPSCCFTPIVADNCFSENEEVSSLDFQMLPLLLNVLIHFSSITQVCSLWTKCSFLYQSDTEFAR